MSFWSICFYSHNRLQSSSCCCDFSYCYCNSSKCRFTCIWFNKTTNPEQLGDKALQADEDGIHPDNYDTFGEYLNAVEEFEIDPDKSKNGQKKKRKCEPFKLTLLY